MQRFSDKMLIHAAIEEMGALREPPSKQAYYKPTAENAVKGKGLINFLMQDKFFLALYRSNDARVRAAAIDKLNKAHYQAYGDVPIKDVDTTSVPVAK